MRFLPYWFGEKPQHLIVHMILIWKVRKDGFCVHLWSDRKFRNISCLEISFPEIAISKAKTRLRFLPYPVGEKPHFLKFYYMH